MDHHKCLKPIAPNPASRGNVAEGQSAANNGSTKAIPDGRHHIDYFSEIEVSEDGKSLLITAVFIDGTSSILAAPYDKAEWLAKAIFRTAGAALQRQTNAGELMSSPIVDDALVAEGIRTLQKPHESMALIEAFGSRKSNGEPGMTSLLIDTALALALIEELRQFVQTAPTLSRPS